MKHKVCTGCFSLAFFPAYGIQPLRTKSCLAEKVCPCLAQPRDQHVWNEQGLCGSRGWDAAPPPLSLVPSLPQYRRGHSHEGMGCKWDHSTCILSNKEGGIAQGESWALPPKPQGPCGSDELHGPRGTYIPGYGVQGHCDKELVTVPQVTMVASQIPPRSMSGLTAW